MDIVSLVLDESDLLDEDSEPRLTPAPLVDGSRELAGPLCCKRDSGLWDVDCGLCHCLG